MNILCKNWSGFRWPRINLHSLQSNNDEAGAFKVEFIDVTFEWGLKLNYNPDDTLVLCSNSQKKKQCCDLTDAYLVIRFCVANALEFKLVQRLCKLSLCSGQICKRCDKMSSKCTRRGDKATNCQSESEKRTCTLETLWCLSLSRRTTD